ncbi:SCP2 sterol-binding domain-containing protein [Numidum massiliense]|uniref:SCP2 sterol-binding domain-containing protein n=1 Tax=Numidum massiliense TaxID=1522315 RepID=UPI0006D59D7A|nr:SCP2 sterol-binding domain-containing protein [Numidum massiliense]
MKTADVFSELETLAKEDAAPIAGMETVYQFDLSGDDGGTYQLHLSQGTANVVQGDEQPADCCIQMSADNFKKLVRGELNAVSAFMFKKLKVKGEVGLAMKLQNIFAQYNRK